MNYLKRYLSNNQQFYSVYKNIFNQKPVLIDHLAHRSFDKINIYNSYLPYKNIFKLENDEFVFKTHNATAEWWSCKSNNYVNDYANTLNNFDKRIKGTPRIFISTYSGVFNDDTIKYTDIDLNQVQWHIDNPTKLITYNLYKKLYKHNQYLAWTLLHRENINHIGIVVDDIHVIADKVSKILPLNNPEAPIQVSEDGDLFQFSTKSINLPYDFIEGTYLVPYNFLEFVERKNNREGFSQKNANIVFDSTK